MLTLIGGRVQDGRKWAYFRPHAERTFSTGSVAIITRCAARRAGDLPSREERRHSMDVYFASAGGFEFDQALGPESWSRRDQVHESRLTRRSASTTVGGYEKPF